MKNLQRWLDIANAYAIDFDDKNILPQEIGNYAGRIMSLLSDTQKEMGYPFNTPIHDKINAARLMLSRMIEVGDGEVEQRKRILELCEERYEIAKQNDCGFGYEDYKAFRAAVEKEPCK